MNSSGSPIYRTGTTNALLVNPHDEVHLVPGAQFKRRPRFKRAEELPRLGPLDGAEPAQGDRRAVGNPRRQAGGGRLVPRAQPQPLRPPAHVGLGEARLDQRERRPALGGRPLARPMVAEVVDVHPQHDRAAFGCDHRLEGRHELVLAPVAAVAVVAGVGGLAQFVGLDLAPAQAPLGGQAGAVVALVAGQRGGDGRHRERPLDTESVGRHPGQEGGVRTSREGHHDAVEAFEHAAKCIERCGAGAGHRDGSLTQKAGRRQRHRPC